MQPSGGHIPVCPVSRRGGNPLLLYTISATCQVAINISVFVRLMLLRPKAASTEFTRQGESRGVGTGSRMGGVQTRNAELGMRNGPVFVPAGLRRGRRIGWPEMPVAGPKGSFEGTGTPEGSNVKQGEIGKPKSVLCHRNSLALGAFVPFDFARRISDPMNLSASALSGPSVPISLGVT